MPDTGGRQSEVFFDTFHGPFLRIHSQSPVLCFLIPGLRFLAYACDAESSLEEE